MLNKEISNNLASRRVNARRVINLRLLAITSVTAILLAGLGFWRYQSASMVAAHSFLARAEALEAEKKWSEASELLQRYLLVRPNDVEARRRLTIAIYESAETPAQAQRAITALYQSLGQHPDDSVLRTKLAELLRQSGDHQAALKEANAVIKAGKDVDAAAAREATLAKLAAANSEDLSAISPLASELLEVAKKRPNDYELAFIVAGLLRQKPGIVIEGTPDLAQAADQLVAAAVRNNAQEPRVWLASYQYSRQFGLPNAADELAKLRAKWPDNVEGMLLEAESALSGPTPDLKKAEATLRQAIRVAPQDPRSHLLLAQILSSQEKHAESAKTLAEGRAQLPNDLSIGLQYVETLISAKDVSLAGDEFAKVAQSAKATAPQLSAEARKLLENRMRILEARLALANERYADVVAPVQAVLASTAGESVEGRSRESLLALELLAQGLAGQRQWDAAAQHWDAQVEALSHAAARSNADPRLKAYRVTALASAANAYQRAGMANEAAMRFGELAVMTASPSVTIRLLQAQLAAQARQPFEARRWEAFLETLAKAKAISPPRWEVGAAEVEYLHLIGQERKEREFIAELEADAAASPELLRYLAVAYQRLGEVDSADRIAERFEKTTAPDSDKLLLKSSLLVARGDYDAALAAMKDAETKAATAELSSQLQLARIQVMLRSGRLPDAIAEVRRLHDPERPNVPLLLVAYEAAINSHEAAAAEEWSNLLSKTAAAGTFDLRYLNAIRQCEDYEKITQERRDQLKREIDALSAERPKWGPARALMGHANELQGNVADAIQDYKLAIELGDVRPRTFEHLINLLYAGGEVSEAQRYLSLAASSAGGNPQLEILAGEIAASRSDLAGLIRLAQESVARHPQDVKKLLWLAQLLASEGKHQEAHDKFVAALQLSPENQQAWLGAFVSVRELGRPEDALKMLNELVSDEAGMSPSEHFLAASAYEILDEQQQARDHFEAGLQAEPDNLPMRMKLAKLLQRLDVLAASKELEVVLAKDPQHSEAKRQLAMTLAVVGGEPEWKRISQLLESTNSGSPSADASADARFLALLLTQRGASRESRLESTRQAQALIEKKISAAGSNVDDVDRLLLAGLFEQEAKLGGDAKKLESARVALEPLVSREKPSTQSLLFYAQFLIRNGAELRPAQEDGGDAETIRAAFLQEAETRLKQIRKSAGDDQLSPALVLQLLALQVALLEASERPDDVAKALDEYAQVDLPATDVPAIRAQSLLLLGDSYHKIGRYADAEKWFRLLAKDDPAGLSRLVQAIAAQDRPDEAVNECMAMIDRGRAPAEAVSVLTALVAEFEEVRESEKVEQFVNELLTNHASDVNLLCSVAALRVSQGQSDDAIKLFRQVVDLSPNNVLALNNLATLLGEVAQYRAEAIRTVDKAIEIAGRRPALLDTKGTIFLNDGRFADAIACLEEAVAGDAKDPRYYFHLAAARFRAGDEGGAQSALEKARELKLDKSLLTAGDLTLLQEMERTPATAPIAN